MKFKRYAKLESGLGQIDIAPLIDMVFQLLIFFMLTSSFVVSPGIKVNLPKAVTSEAIEERSTIITITADNVIYLNNSLVTSSELKEYLRKVAKNNVPILIKADKKASLGRVVEVWDAARDLDMKKINIATNP